MRILIDNQLEYKIENTEGSSKYSKSNAHNQTLGYINP